MWLQTLVLLRGAGVSHLINLAKMKFRPVVLSGPSGSGKSTILKMLFTEYPDCFAFSVSHTTRKPRPGEEDGKDYYFVSREDFLSGIEKGEFLEHAEFSGNMYGTSKQAVQHVIDTGKICILDIEEHGVKSVKETDLNARFVFLKTIDLETLEERLRGRGTETEESLQKRMNTAKSAIEYSNQQGAYDHIIVNTQKEVAYEYLKGLLIQDIEALQSSK